MSNEQKEIDVASLEKFKSHNDEIITLLSRGSNDVNDILTTTGYLVENIPTINDKLSQLKNVSVDPVATTNIESRNTAANEILNFYSERATHIVAALDYSEFAIPLYNSGKYKIDVTAEDLCNANYVDIMQKLSDAGVWWALGAHLINNTKTLKGLGYGLEYSTDAQYAGGDFVVGDSAKYMIDKVFDIGYFKGDTSLINLAKITGYGAVIVGGYEAAKAWYNDKGKFDYNLDTKRVAATGVEAGAQFFLWTISAAAIEEAAVAAGAGSAAGPVGAFGATAVTLIAKPAFDYAKDRFTGDYILDSYAPGYEIPRNGNGAEGTYDVILENASSKYKNYTIGDKTYTEKNYKNMMYSNPSDVVGKNNAVVTNKDMKQLNNALEDLKKAGTPAERKAIVEDIRHDLQPKQVTTHGTYYTSNYSNNTPGGVYTEMNRLYDFDIDEYCEYNNIQLN